jgi:hypothetical protein
MVDRLKNEYDNEQNCAFIPPVWTIICFAIKMRRSNNDGEKVMTQFERDFFIIECQLIIFGLLVFVKNIF